MRISAMSSGIPRSTCCPSTSRSGRRRHAPCSCIAHTLSGARAKANAMGYRGALYAWESADTGEETTPEQVVGPSGEMIDILTGRMEQHISADIAYAVWQYWRPPRAGGELICARARLSVADPRLQEALA